MKNASIFTGAVDTAGAVIDVLKSVVELAFDLVIGGSTLENESTIDNWLSSLSRDAMSLIDVVAAFVVVAVAILLGSDVFVEVVVISSGFATGGASAGGVVFSFLAGTRTDSDLIGCRVGAAIEIFSKSLNKSILDLGCGSICCCGAILTGAGAGFGMTFVVVA